MALRFLGSPTVRVYGVDIEPGAEERRDVAFAVPGRVSIRPLGSHIPPCGLRLRAGAS